MAGFGWTAGGMMRPTWIGLSRSRTTRYKIKLYRTEGHQRNFIDCVKSRQPTITPVETAHHSAIPGHLGLISMLVGRKIRWDPVNEVILDDAEASKFADAAVPAALETGLIREFRELTRSNTTKLDYEKTQLTQLCARARSAHPGRRHRLQAGGRAAGQTPEACASGGCVGGTNQLRAGHVAARPGRQPLRVSQHGAMAGRRVGKGVRLAGTVGRHSRASSRRTARTSRRHSTS